MIAVVNSFRFSWFYILPLLCIYFADFFFLSEAVVERVPLLISF